MAVSTVRAAKRSLAVMFPGQGSQFPGMTRDLVEASRKARQLVQRADDILGYRLSRIMLSDDGDTLLRTVHTQPAVFVHSMALWELLQERFSLMPIMAAGHSLGEYSALVAAGVLEFSEALDIISVRAKSMDEAQPAGTCGMAAVVGATRDQVLDMVNANRGNEVLEAANFNAPDQVVVSGHLVAVDRVAEASKSIKRARTVKLPVSSAFHTSLMEPAREALAERLESVGLGQPKFPVAANVTAKPYHVDATAVKLMADQVVRPVLWEDCVKTMLEAGADLFVEVGPGKVLTGLLRRIARNSESVNVDGPESVTSFESLVG